MSDTAKTETTDNTLVPKIVKILSLIKRIPKNGYNEFHKYKYATESDVVEHVREFLAAEGIALFFDVKSVENVRVVKTRSGEAQVIRVGIKVTMTDGHSSADCLIFGEAMDSGDKAIYKAYTGAIKYFFLKTFLIGTGDDPEAETESTQAAHQQSKQPPQMDAGKAFAIEKLAVMLSDELKMDYDTILDIVKSWADNRLQRAFEVVKELEDGNKYAFGKMCATIVKEFKGE